MINFNAIFDTIIEQTILYLPKVVSAVIILLLGLWIIGITVKVLNKQMQKRKVDLSLHHFLSSLAKVSLKVLLFITVISMLGVQVTSFIAILGAAGLAVGLALQGSLSNFAGGVLILLFKPFKVGDLVEAQGFIGKVHQIQIFNTILKTPDNKTIVIPNGNLSNGSITNFSTEKERRADLTFSIGYSEDISKAKKVINDIIKQDKRILNEPKSAVLVSGLADSSVNLAVRVWCKGVDYWGVYFDMNEKIKLGFDKNKISIPFPQRDVHLYKH